MRAVFRATCAARRKARPTPAAKLTGRLALVRVFAFTAFSPVIGVRGPNCRTPVVGQKAVHALQIPPARRVGRCHAMQPHSRRRDRFKPRIDYADTATLETLGVAKARTAHWYRERSFLKFDRFTHWFPRGDLQLRCLRAPQRGGVWT